MKCPRLLLVTLAGVTAGSAQSASSSYTLLHSPAGDIGGGGRINNTGGTIVADISSGDAASGMVSQITTGGVQAKINLIGQLYDPKSVSVDATPATIDEGGTRQISAKANLDDATVLDLRGTPGTIWSNGTAIAGLNIFTGIATAAAVHQNTSTSVAVRYRGIQDNVALNILDIDKDNFSSYGGDLLDDAWQVQYFGQPPNSLAAPNEDPDGDGRSNRLEFLSGFGPTDSVSFFQFAITGRSSNTATFRLNKVVPGRTYTVKANTDLQTAPTMVGAPFSVGAEELDRVVLDPSAEGGRKFYYLEISKP